ncbi:hypothetical protein CEXT_473381 [Caerostris extrusa]|uniref:Uncharacterized protein n=1 Tax=Caerostris extrusa TaxID=172846 RepID=A0AAV4VF17_CAEEX|nr:hypothetical protein CEXT_473381 [Caerostris extrusa]
MAARIKFIVILVIVFLSAGVHSAGLLEGVKDAIKDAISCPKMTLKQIISLLVSTILMPVEAILGVASLYIDMIKESSPELGNFIEDALNKIVGIINDVANLFMDAGLLDLSSR